MANPYRILRRNNRLSLRQSTPIIAFLGVLLCSLFTITSHSIAQGLTPFKTTITSTSKPLKIGQSLIPILDPQGNFDNAYLKKLQTSQRDQNFHSSGNKLFFKQTSNSFWFLLTLENTTNHPLWGLDLGSSPADKFGTIKEITIIDSKNKRQIIAWKKGLDNTVPSMPIKIVLPKRSTTTLAIGLTFSKPFDNQLSPILRLLDPRLEKATMPSYGTLISLALLIAAGFFIAYVPVNAAKIIHYSFAFYALLCVAFIQFGINIHFAHDYLNEHTLLLIISLTAIAFILTTNISAARNIAISAALCIIIIATTTLVTLPVSSLDSYDLYIYSGSLILCLAIAVFKPAQKHHRDNTLTHQPNAFFKAANALTLLAAIGSILGYTFGQTSLNFLQNLFIITLAPQMLLYIVATTKQAKENAIEERNTAAKKNRSVYGLARLQQSKDSADQARLIRVIEKERELMTDLREQEAKRADEMKRAKEAADNANAEKSAFLAVVSHEIRTPMNGIMGILKLLQGTKPTTEQNEFLLTMQKSGETMVALLNDILDFEKIENGSMELENINIELHTMVKGISTLMSGYIKGKDVELITDISQSVPPFVIGDPTRLQQVLFNLISNAIKFTDKGRVVIKLEKALTQPLEDDLHAITFTVSDTGIGISEDAQKTLFEPFKQAESSTSRKYGGTGLGLAICLRLIKNMGSTITVQSIMGQGSHFSFTLTMPEGYAADTQDTQRTQPEQITAPAQPPQSPLRIAVIEDNDINRKVLTTLLEKDTHTVTGFSSAEEALKSISTIEPDIIFSDINLLGMNGLDFAQRIRSSDFNDIINNTPIIGLTGSVSPDDVQKMRDAGFNGFLPKPIEYEKVQSILTKITPRTHNNSAENSADSVADNAPASSPSYTDIMPPAQPQSQEPPIETPVEAPTDQTLPITATRTPPSDNNHSPEISEQPLVASRPEPTSPEETPSSDTSDTTDIINQDLIPETETDEDTGMTYNFTLLNDLYKSLGEDSLLELLTDCVDQIDISLADFKDGQNTNNDQIVYSRMHELKGMCHNFGIDTIGNLAAKCEENAKKSNLDDIPATIEKILSLKHQIEDDIKDWIKNRDPHADDDFV